MNGTPKKDTSVFMDFKQLYARRNAEARGFKRYLDSSKVSGLRRRSRRVRDTSSSGVYRVVEPDNIIGPKIEDFPETPCRTVTRYSGSKPSLLHEGWGKLCGIRGDIFGIPRKQKRSQARSANDHGRYPGEADCRRVLFPVDTVQKGFSGISLYNQPSLGDTELRAELLSTSLANSGEFLI